MQIASNRTQNCMRIYLYLYFQFYFISKSYGHRAVRSILGVVGNDVTGFGVGLIPVC